MRAFRNGVGIIAVLILPLVSTGCVRAGDEPVAPCECPDTEAIVLSIDWLGDGTVATSYESTRRGLAGEELPAMDLAFLEFDGIDDGTRALATLLRRLEAGGLAIEGIGTVRMDSARVVIESPTDDGSDGQVRRVILVRVDLLVEDEHAAPALQPLVDALGIID